ncbi:MATE family efflux transporter [Litoreibacter arenae]|uniref:Multi antimicrobial extrusion protein (Na(+)/drug antiporter) n=1 Tax=Litoreibacter arenae DSM 19593 TaxID=1123360 RepID=S9QJ97_9RHOB|nr:MATE family efflux transporter [Litoreibacter arenae]EPX79892.1 Multi antimicrobial extrusion protein (Na(+)/drug antiporter) [Litoreibacter arenae DSM 19593]
MSKAKKRDLTKGPVWIALTAMSAPMSFGIFAVIAIGLADAYFLGKVSATALAAVGFIYPVTIAVTSLSIGLSAGANATLSQAVGRGDADEAVRRLGLHAIGLGLALSVAAALLLWPSYPYLFAAMGAGDDALTEIGEYVPLWALSFPFLVVMMITNAVFRAHGDGATSAAIMVLAAVFGIALNPVLIFGWGPLPELGTLGAALSTFVGRVIAMVTALWIAWRRGMLGVCGNVLDGLLASFRSVLSVGIPAAFSNAINPAGMALVTAAVATVGETAVAGFGAASRIQSFALVPLMALSSGIGPVVGQNWGAEDRARAQTATQQAFLFCVVYGLALAAVLIIFADTLAGWVGSGGEDVAYAASYLRIVGISMFGYGIVVVANAAMNAREKALWSLSLSLGRILVIYLPLAWLGVTIMGYTGILFAAVAANLLGAWGGLVATRSTDLVRIDIPGIKTPLRKLDA